jgi:hypothetical protein
VVHVLTGAMLARLVVRAKSGSLTETAAWATKQKRGRAGSAWHDAYVMGDRPVAKSNDERACDGGHRKRGQHDRRVAACA